MSRLDKVTNSLLQFGSHRGDRLSGTDRNSPDGGELNNGIFCNQISLHKNRYIKWTWSLSLLKRWELFQKRTIGYSL